MLDAYEFGTAKSIFEKLWDLYPGYDWKVRVMARQGVAQVQIGTLMRSTYGEILKLDDLASDPSLTLIKRAGGKLLEMLMLRREKANRDAVRTLKAQANGLFPFAAPMAGMERPKSKVLLRPATNKEAEAMVRAAANSRQIETQAAA